MRRKIKRRMPRAVSRTLTSLALGVAVIAVPAISGQNSAPDTDTTIVSSIPMGKAVTPFAGVSVPARQMPVCGTARRVNCIVDGDTFWLEGVKYRIANIDTPELRGKCSAEQNTAKRARQRLAEIINDRPVEVRVTGVDPYGRTLVYLSDATGDIGDRMVGEGLAEVWGGDFIDWCRG
jgi:micrococcal nuclease